MNPYAASTVTIEPRSARNILRLLMAVVLLFVVPSALLYGYLKIEKHHPILFQQFEDGARDRQIDRWQKQIDQTHEAMGIIPKQKT